MTKEQVDAIRARLNAVSDEEWFYDCVEEDQKYIVLASREEEELAYDTEGREGTRRVYGAVSIADCSTDPQLSVAERTHNSALIANAPTDLRALLDEVERLTKERDEARASRDNEGRAFKEEYGQHSETRRAVQAAALALHEAGVTPALSMDEATEGTNGQALAHAIRRLTSERDSAYRRGAEAMREAAVNAARSVMTKGFFVPAHVKAVVVSIRDLPVPEDKP